MKQEEKKINRRTALKMMGAGVVGAVGIYYGLESGLFKKVIRNAKDEDQILPVTTRKNRRNQDKVSLLGFGCMRFPVLEKGKSEINEELAIEMIDYAYQRGVNYFDTAWIYHEGMSEKFIGKALKKYPRESFFLADKMPTWLIDSLDKGTEIFQAQLDRCQVEYFDYYLLHSLGKPDVYDRVYEEYGLYEYLNQEKKKGRIRQLGFSFHGHRDNFPYLLDKHPWDFVMIQANYYDWDKDGKYLYNELVKRNIQCIIMEPIRGGMLATLNPGAVRILKRADSNRSVASWALQFIASKPNVLTVLSGMTHIDHVVDNVNTFTNFEPMMDNEHSIVQQALKEFLRLSPIPCTECRYCVPCPAGIEIPGIFGVYNQCVSQSYVPDITNTSDPEFKQKKRIFLGSFNDKIPRKQQADRCINCDQCIITCPQSIPIPDKLSEIATLIDQLNKI